MHIAAYVVIICGAMNILRSAVFQSRQELPAIATVKGQALRQTPCFTSATSTSVWTRQRSLCDLGIDKGNCLCCRYIDMINAASGLAESMLRNPALAAQTQASGVGPRIAIMAQPGAIAAHDARHAMSLPVPPNKHRSRTGSAEKVLTVEKVTPIPSQVASMGPPHGLRGWWEEWHCRCASHTHPSVSGTMSNLL
jgi:hypothetical protein